MSSHFKKEVSLFFWKERQLINQLIINNIKPNINIKKRQL